MMKKIKSLIVLGILMLTFIPMNVLAEEPEQKVCFYVKNYDGELEYVCVDSNTPAPCQIGCPPGCKGNDD